MPPPAIAVPAVGQPTATPIASVLPANPPTSALVAAALAAKAKPLTVNVDPLILNPPKRKPGRPAKLASSTTTLQPRGPGRPPKLVRPPEVVVVGQAAPVLAAAKKDQQQQQQRPVAVSPCLKRAKVVVAQCSSRTPVKPQAPAVEVEETADKRPSRKSGLRRSLADSSGEFLSVFLSFCQGAWSSWRDGKN